MSEKVPTQEDEIRKTVIAAAQDPVFYLRENYEKGAREAIIFLTQVRNLIKEDPTYEIEQPHPDFKTFYNEGNGQVTYYEAMIKMLQQAGFERHEVASALMDMLPTAGEDMNHSEAAKQYVYLTEQALNTTYGEE